MTHLKKVTVETRRNGAVHKVLALQTQEPEFNLRGGRERERGRERGREREGERNEVLASTGDPCAREQRQVDRWQMIASQPILIGKI
jgi:hypothetical protein